MTSSEDNGAADISMVMTGVLGQLERVVQHLRVKGEYAAANSIAKDTISIIATFNDATAPWDIGQSMMRPPSPPTPVHTPSPHNMPQATISSPTPPPSSGTPTWAAIAAVTPAAGNRIVKFTPQDAIKTKAADPVSTNESDLDERRVVWIQGWKEDRPLRDVSNKIGQGPIYSMAFSAQDSAVCIIFQYASSARAFINEDSSQNKRTGLGLFGKGCVVFAGMPFPFNDDIRKMLPPHNERRRLTFSRQQLFTNGLTEEVFREDIFKIVGRKNVELVWLFNSGNATAVFSAVPIARTVRDEFRQLATVRNSPYSKVVVSFSHDPCEKPMSLMTQMPAGAMHRNLGAYGGVGTLPDDVAFKSSSVTRRDTFARPNHNSGWQTVPFRKRM